MARPVVKKENKKAVGKVVDIKKKSTKEREERGTKKNKKEEVVEKKGRGRPTGVKYILPDDFQEDLSNSFLKIEKALKNARAPMNRFIDAHVKSAVPEARKYLQAAIVEAKNLRKMLQEGKAEVKTVKK